MLDSIIKRLYHNIFKKTFPFWQKFGLNITRNYFLSPIPDLRDLKEEVWSRQTQLVGIEINEKKQLELLSLFERKYKNEYNKFPQEKKDTLKLYEYHLNNISFGSVSGEFLYSMIRHFKPKKIIEIGSGNSTLCSAQAIRKNKENDNDYKCELIAIEPYPNKILKKGFPGLSKLIQKKVQDIPLSEFKKLKENDILFIDSSHILKIGGDVQYEYLEILPRLNKGVIIHIHDILLPAEYFKEWFIKEQMFLNEQYLLQAFLTFNDSFEILWGGSYMHLQHPKKLKSAFKSFDGKRISTSFWMRKIK